MAKLAAFDMDGTLLMPDHRLGEQTLTALKRLRLASFYRKKTENL